MVQEKKEALWKAIFEEVESWPEWKKKSIMYPLLSTEDKRTENVEDKGKDLMLCEG